MQRESDDSNLWKVQVDCYEGYRAEESPRRFQWGSISYPIEEIVDRWYGPEDAYYKVKTYDGDLYILKHSWNGIWTVESFRRGNLKQPASQCSGNPSVR